MTSFFLLCSFQADEIELFSLEYIEWFIHRITNNLLHNFCGVMKDSYIFSAKACSAQCTSGRTKELKSSLGSLRGYLAEVNQKLRPNTNGSMVFHHLDGSVQSLAGEEVC